MEPSQKRRQGSRRARGSVGDVGVDERLSTILATVRAGQFKEQPWELFRITHFPGLTAVEMADVLGPWAARHRVKITLREGRTELAGKLYLVPQLLLTAGT